MPLSDGALEFNYWDGRSSDVAGTSVLKCWEVDPADFDSGGKHPWEDGKLAVVRAVFADDFAQAGVASAAYWFLGCANMLSVEGLEALASVTNMRQIFPLCAKLETIHAEGFGDSTVTGAGALKMGAGWELPESATGMQAFYQCTSLTGGNGTAFDAKSAGAGMMRIDREGRAGYLTAG